MATTRDYTDYLNDQVDIAPVNSQEELQAAQVLEGLFAQHGLETQIEEFDAPVLASLSKNLYYIVLFMGILLAGFIGTPVGTFGLMLTLISFALIALEHNGTDALADIGPKARSQNVIGVHRATGPNVVKGNRPIVIVAHIDTPRENFLYKSNFAKWQPIIKRISWQLAIAVLALAVFQILPFISPMMRHVFWVIGVLIALPLLMLGAAALYERFAPCTSGANDNKAALAAMLGVLDQVRPGPDEAKEWAASHPKGVRRSMEAELEKDIYGDEWAEGDQTPDGEESYGEEEPYGEESPIQAADDGMDMESYIEEGYAEAGVDPYEAGVVDDYADDEMQFPEEDAQADFKRRYARAQRTRGSYVDEYGLESPATVRRGAALLESLQVLPEDCEIEYENLMPRDEAIERIGELGAEVLDEEQVYLDDDYPEPVEDELYQADDTDLGPLSDARDGAQRVFGRIAGFFSGLGERFGKKPSLPEIDKAEKTYESDAIYDEARDREAYAEFEREHDGYEGQPPAAEGVAETEQYTGEFATVDATAETPAYGVYEPQHVEPVVSAPAYDTTGDTAASSFKEPAGYDDFAAGATASFEVQRDAEAIPTETVPAVVGPDEKGTTLPAPPLDVDMEKGGTEPFVAPVIEQVSAEDAGLTTPAVNVAADAAPAPAVSMEEAHAARSEVYEAAQDELDDAQLASDGIDAAAEALIATASEQPLVESVPMVDDELAEEVPIADVEVIEEPEADEALVEVPLVDEATGDEPIVDELAAEEPAADEPFAEEPVVDELVVEEPATDESAADEPVADETFVDEAADDAMAEAEAAADDAVEPADEHEGEQQPEEEPLDEAALYEEGIIDVGEEPLDLDQEDQDDGPVEVTLVEDAPLVTPEDLEDLPFTKQDIVDADFELLDDDGEGADQGKLEVELVDPSGIMDEAEIVDEGFDDGYDDGFDDEIDIDAVLDEPDGVTTADIESQQTQPNSLAKTAPMAVEEDEQSAASTAELLPIETESAPIETETKAEAVATTPTGSDQSRASILHRMFATRPISHIEDTDEAAQDEPVSQSGGWSVVKSGEEEAAEVKDAPEQEDSASEPEPEAQAASEVQEDKAEEKPSAPEPDKTQFMSGLTFSSEVELSEEELAQKDVTGLSMVSEEAEADAEAAMPPVEEHIPKPRAIDDPSWGKSTFRPSAIAAGRRATLLDLPDPSVIASDPFDARHPGGAVPDVNGFGRQSGGDNGSTKPSRRLDMLSNLPSPREEAKPAPEAAEPKPAPEPRQEPAARPLAQEPLEPVRGSRDARNKSARAAKKSNRLKMRFGRGRKQQDEQVESMGEWLGLDEDYDAKKNGRQIGTWDNFGDDDDDGRGKWKGGAAVRAGLRGNDSDEGRLTLPSFGEIINDTEGDTYDGAAYEEPLAEDSYDESLAAPASEDIEFDDVPLEDVPLDEPAEPVEEVDESVLRFGDDDIIAHDVWFVGTGASSLGHAGIKAFLKEHRKDLRGAFLVNLDCIGAGDLRVLANEGTGGRRRADRRLMRMLCGIANAMNVDIDRADYTWNETEATAPMQRSIRVSTLMGMNADGLPAHSHTSADEPELLDDQQIANVAQIIADLIRQS